MQRFSKLNFLKFFNHAKFPIFVALTVSYTFFWATSITVLTVTPQWVLDSWNPRDLGTGHCEFRQNNISSLAKALDDAGYHWAIDRVRQGLPAYASTTDFPKSPVFDCPEVSTKGIQWIDRYEGLFSCTPGETIKLSYLEDQSYWYQRQSKHYSWTQCPNDGSLTIDPGTVASAELGILIRPAVISERIEQRLECLDEKLSEYNEDEAPPDILVILIDAISRPMQERLLVKTNALFQEIIDEGGVTRFNFRRAHTAGGGTIRNTIPMLTGVHLRDLDGYIESHGDYDGPWVYKELSEKSCYVTGINFSGARKTHGTWPINDPKKWGWAFPQSRMPYGPSMIDDPWNYQTFSDNGLPNRCGITPQGPCALSDESTRQGEKPCVGGRSMPMLMAENYLEFRHRLMGVPTFNWFHMMQVHGNDLLLPSRFDEEFVLALEKLKDAGVFRNTAVFVISDHGYHGAARMQLEMGPDEVKQPVRMLFMPDQILDRLPGAREVLERNQAALNSPNDLFHTWLHLGSWSKTAPGFPRGRGGGGASMPPIDGQSLMTPMSPNRTCLDAGIDPAECICGASVEVPVPDECQEFVLTRTLPVVMKKLNEGVMSSPQVCRKLVMKSVGRMVHRPLSRVSARYEIDIEMETPRSVPFVLRVSFQGWNCHGNDDKPHASIRNGRWEKVKILGALQENRFEPWIGQCKEEAAGAGIDLHLCDCIDAPPGGWGTDGIGGGDV